MIFLHFCATTAILKFYIFIFLLNYKLLDLKNCFLAVVPRSKSLSGKVIKLSWEAFQFNFCDIKCHYYLYFYLEVDNHDKLAIFPLKSGYRESSECQK
jgi:hypothetical protein